MLNRKIWMLLTVLLSSQLFAQSTKPGFSCDEQLNYSEMAICSSSYLSSLDKYLNILYRQYQELSFSPATLKENQLAWWRERNSCETRDCIDKIYDARIREMISGIKRIDSGFSALEPSLVVKRFNERKNAYSPVSIEATVGRINNEDAGFFPIATFRFISGEIRSFERLKRNAYRFQYSYQTPPPLQTIVGSFIVDDSANIVSVDVSSTYTDSIVGSGMGAALGKFSTTPGGTTRGPISLHDLPSPPTRLRVTSPVTVNGGRVIKLQDQHGTRGQSH